MYLYVCTFELQDRSSELQLFWLFVHFRNSWILMKNICPLQAFFFFNYVMYYAIIIYFVLRPFVAKLFFFPPIVHIPCHYSGLPKFLSLELYLIWLVLLLELLEICHNGVWNTRTVFQSVRSTDTVVLNVWQLILTQAAKFH